IGERFQLYLDLDLSDIPPRYNAAPTQMLPVITERDGQRRLQAMKWGLVPSWAKDRTRPMINARAEGIQDKPTFRTPFKRQRCLVPATHFFEWQTVRKMKQPYLIRPTDQPLFAFAGLYDVHYDPVLGDLHSFSIITTEANAVTAPIHDRMPVILQPELEAVWLEPKMSALELQLLLGQYPAARMEAFPVDAVMNLATG
ncbi:MAG TPA: SOS response-associated peptidase, partial [Chloroflexota bacterium]|nr:SOS response-associated peptidase [Chloroflexota bacterium]